MNYTIVTIIVALGIAQRIPAAAMDDGTNDINRINFGVIFKYIKKEHIVNQVVSHSFVFNLPHQAIDKDHHYLMGSTNVSVDDVSKGWYAKCVHQRTRKLFPEQYNATDLRGNEYNESFDVKSVCQALASDMNHSIILTKTRHQRLLDLVNEIDELLPPDVITVGKAANNTARNKRRDALIPIIGDISNTLFGVATDSELQTMVLHSKEIAETLRRHDLMLAGIWHESMNISAKMDNRIDSIAQTFNKHALATHKIILDYRNSLDRERTKRELGYTTERLGLQLEEARIHLEKFKMALQILALGKLPRELVTPTMLKNALGKIKQHMRAKQYYLITQEPFGYYRESRFTTAITGFYPNNHLLITVEIPLTSYKNKFHLYEMVYLDMPVPHNNNSVMKVKSTSSGLLIGGQGSEIHFKELSAVELYTIKNGVRNQVGSRVLNRNWGQNCMISIYRQHDARVKKFCEYTIYPKQMKPSIRYLHANQFVLTAVSEYYVKNESSRILKKGCQQCIIQLGDGKEILTDEFIISSGGHHVDSNDEVKHTVNKPILSHFFTDNELRMIKGDTLFNSIAALELPNITLSRPGEVDLIAEDSEVKILMSKAMEAVKTRSKIYHTFADKVYEEVMKEEIPDIHFTWLDYLTMATCGLASLSFVYLILISIKFTKMAASIAIIERMLKANAAQDLNLKYSVNDEQQSATTEKAWQNEPYGWNQGWMNLPWIWFIAGLGIGITVSTILWVICHWYTKKETRFETSLALNIAVSNKGKIITLMKIHVPASDLEVRALNGPTNLFVNGYLSPKLHYNWDAQLVIKSLNVAKMVPRSVRISYQEARILRNVLERNHNAVAIFADGVRVKAVPGIPQGTRNRRPSQSSLTMANWGATSAEATGQPTSQIQLI